MKIFQIVTLDIVDYNFKNKIKMKKSKAIELLKAQTHSIKMDRREGKDVQLLNEILRETNVSKITGPLCGNNEYYYVINNGLGCSYSENPHPHHINISEIEVDDEFVNGEYYEFSDDGIDWSEPLFYVGKDKDGKFVCHSKRAYFTTFDNIRKPQTERDKAIQTIKELKDKFNIKNEEV
jgi:hypothetical protein